MKKIIILGVLLVVVVGGIVWFIKGSMSNSLGSQTVKHATPADAVDDFYGQWLRATQDSSLLPDRATLLKSPILSKELQVKVVASLQSGAALDPVLCQSEVPQGITIRNVYEQADEAQMLVT